MLRALPLPQAVPGALFLSAMPGRCEPLAECFEGVSRQNVTHIVCLTLADEIAAESPEYLKAIEAGALPCEHGIFGLEDHGVATDRGQFLALAKDIAARLGRGERIMIHCKAGIGRTGTLAISVLLVLGMPLDKAITTVEQSGSRPETEEQSEFIQWVAGQGAEGRKQ
jgi:protein-tyrosine phosphatase